MKIDEKQPTLTADEARAVFLREVEYLRGLAEYLDRQGDTAPASPRLFLRRAVGKLTEARGFIEQAAEYLIAEKAP